MKVLKLHFWEYKLVFEAWDMKCVEKMYERYYLENYETRWQMVNWKLKSRSLDNHVEFWENWET